MKTRTRSWHDSLLATKFFAPPPRAGRVLRPRLTEQLERALCAGHKLVLIAAPAGFGKTTIVGDWLAGDAARRTARWLTLDEADNDLARFLMYLLGALEPLATKTEPWDALVQRLSDYPAPPVESILTPVLNDLAPGAGAETFSLLILEDYHLVQNAAIHQALTFLIERLPPRMHVVITTRTDPPLPLARWMARGEMSQIRADDLSFNPDEATRFLNGTMRLQLEPLQIAALEARTEGWIAGLQLAGIALASAEASRAPQEDRARFITAFAGTHRVVLDYLIEEVLQRQPGNIQQFLLQTSILERLNPALCDAVQGDGETARGTLDELERAHLFLTPLDDAREWYRYHPLWMEALRHRFQVTDPGQARAAHERASEWFEQNDWIAEAVHHAFAAKHVERAARLIQKHATWMIHRGEFAPLRDWFARLPDTAYETRARLCLARAWWLFLTGARQEAHEWLRRAERVLQGSEMSPAEAAVLGGEMDTLHSAILLELGDWQGAMRHAARARELIGDAKVGTRGLAEMCSALARFWGGQVEGVDRELQAASESARTVGNLLIAFTSACHQGEVIMMQGRVREAMAHFRALEARAREWGVEHRPFAALLHVNWGMAHFELNDLEASRAAFLRAMELSDFGTAPREWLIGAAFVAWLDHLKGDRQSAMEWVRRGEEHLREYQVPAWASSHLIDTEQGLELWDFDYDDTRRWLEHSELAFGDAPDYVNELAQLTVARVQVLHGEYDAALRRAQRMTAAAEKARRLGSLPRLYTFEALLYARRGDRAQALERLRAAIELGETRGFIRSIIDEGKTIQEMLAEMRENPRPGDTPARLGYVNRLLRAAEADSRTASGSPHAAPVTFSSDRTDAPPTPGTGRELPAPPSPAKTIPRADSPVESLSLREMEVLRLIANGYSNREIAGELVVGLGTVKTHVNNIFRKLDALSRTQALKRARECGLIE